MNGIESIAAERQRQIEAEGWTPEHDDKHDAGEIAGAGAAYALNAACLLCPHHGTPLNEPPESWLWERDWWKPNLGDAPRRDLVKAGALIAAEIDRLDRAAARERTTQATTEFDLPLDEFTEEFVKELVRLGGETFADGSSVEDYAREIAPSYYAEKFQREDGPEACAEADFDCWERVG